MSTYFCQPTAIPDRKEIRLKVEEVDVLSERVERVSVSAGEVSSFSLSRTPAAMLDPGAVCGVQSSKLPQMNQQLRAAGRS